MTSGIPSVIAHLGIARPVARAEAVNCWQCTRQMFDGQTITVRCLKVREDGRVMGKCKHCKCFSLLPLMIQI